MKLFTMNKIFSLLSPRHQVILAGISALILSVGIARFAYTPFLPIMLEQTTLTPFMGGWLASFNYIGYLCGLIMISLIRRLETKFWLYRFNLILAVVTTLLMAFSTNVVFWSSLRFLAGMSSTAGIILAAGFVMGWLKHYGHKANLGIHFSGLGLGIAIPGLIIFLISSHLNWAQQWFAMGILGLFFLVPAWLLMPAPLAAPKSEHSQKKPNKRWMQLMIAAYACAGVGYVISATFIVAILEDMPNMAGKGSLIWVMLGLAAIPSCLFWEKIALHFGESRAILLAYLLMLVSIVIPIVSQSFALNLLGAFLFGGTFAGVVSLMLVYVGHKHQANPAKAMAKLTISYGIAQLIAPAIAGYLSTLTGDYHAALWMAAIVMLIGVLIVTKIQQADTI